MTLYSRRNNYSSFLNLDEGIPLTVRTRKLACSIRQQIANSIIDMASKENEQKRARKANWTSDEVTTFLAELQLIGAKLFGANTPQNITKIKATLWQRMAHTISALGVAVRTASELKLKWKGFKKDVIDKDSEVRKTGGGSIKAQFIPYEETIRAIIGEGSALFTGIEGMSIYVTYSYIILKIGLSQCSTVHFHLSVHSFSCNSFISTVLKIPFCIFNINIY